MATEPVRTPYREPEIIRLGQVATLTRGHNGDICDGPPCVGLYRPFSAADYDHEHDPETDKEREVRTPKSESE